MGPRAGGRPNILLVILDDVGFGQLGCYGSSIATPAIDGLAAEGLRYTNFHTTGICSSTRASLFTGRNHHAVNVGSVFYDESPGRTGRLPASAASVAELLHDGGYATYCVGKWHLANPGEGGVHGPFDSWPLGRGFERYYGFVGGVTSQWAPDDLVEDNRRIRPPRTPEDGYHLSEDLVDHAIGMLRDRDGDDRPFLMWLAFGAAHEPHHVARQHIDPYRGAFDHGWDIERERVFERQLASGVAGAGAVLPPRNPGNPAWADLDSDSRTVFAHMHAVFAGFLTHADLQIGRLVDHLRDSGELDDTLVMVLSDNGASGEGGARGFMGHRSHPYHFLHVPDEVARRDGVRPDRIVIPMLFDADGNPVHESPDSVSEMLEHLDEMGGPTTYGHYPQGWATVGNTPFRRYKGTVHYGGVKDPLVVRWPAAVGDPGGLRGQFHHAVDIMPTLLAVAGIGAPEARGDIRQMRMDGTDLSYTFGDAQAPSTRGTQYFEMYGHRGIYHEGWKAVAFHRRDDLFTDDVWELYDTRSDPTESHDLAGEQPERLRSLVDLWFAEAERNQVLPLDDRPFIDIRFSPGPRTFYEYPPVRSITGDRRPDLFRSSFRLEVAIHLGTPAVDGVLVANGRTGAGQVLYVRDGWPVFEWQAGGDSLQLRSGQRLAAGGSSVGVTVDRVRRLATMLIDDSAVATAPVTGAFEVDGQPGEMDLGRDPEPAVSGSYTSPFDFAGLLRRVRVITDSAVFDADSDDVLSAAMREQ